MIASRCGRITVVPCPPSFCSGAAAQTLACVYYSYLVSTTAYLGRDLVCIEHAGEAKLSSPVTEPYGVMIPHLHYALGEIILLTDAHVSLPQGITLAQPNLTVLGARLDASILCSNPTSRPCTLSFVLLPRLAPP